MITVTRRKVAILAAAALGLVGASVMANPAEALDPGELQPGSNVTLGAFTATLPEPDPCTAVDGAFDCTFNVTGGEDPSTVRIQCDDTTFTPGTSFTMQCDEVIATIDDSTLGVCTLTLQDGDRSFPHDAGDQDHYKLMDTVGPYTFGVDCGPAEQFAVILAIGSSPSTASFNADFHILEP